MTVNEQKCYKTHAGKTALEVFDKEIHLPALVAPTFEKKLIAVSKLTAKGNIILFT